MIEEALEDTMLRVLIAAAFISLAIGVIEDGWEEGWLEGFAIFAAVLTIVCVTAGNNWMKE
jgi:magnesium-transporting ATPase (P-type)